MGRSLTNNTSLSVAIEDSVGVLPGSPIWDVLEPNSINTFGAEITTVSRDPISVDRQRRKGSVTDLDSAMEFEADYTFSHFDDFIEGFIFATAVNSDLEFVGGNATGIGYTIPSATAAQAAKLQFVGTGPISLVYARGYVTTANNGLKPLTADVAATDTEIVVSGRKSVV